MEYNVHVCKLVCHFDCLSIIHLLSCRSPTVSKNKHSQTRKRNKRQRTHKDISLVLTIEMDVAAFQLSTNE